MFEGENDLDLKITTRGMNVSDLRSLGLTAIPLLEQTPQGTWRGWARYHWARDAAGEWSGEYELQNARVEVPGLADPLRILSAAVSLNGARVSVSRLRAKVGTVEFSGDYRWEPTAVRPHKFHITIPEAEDTELERILMPTMIRERGFFARTLRLGAARVPEWLKTRRADGAVSIESLTVADTVVRIDSARLLWDASLVRLTGVSGHLDEAAVAGDLEVHPQGTPPTKAASWISKEAWKRTALAPTCSRARGRKGGSTDARSRSRPRRIFKASRGVLRCSPQPAARAGSSQGSR